MVMHAYRTKTGFFRNSSAKLKVNNTEKRKNNAVKASSTKYFRFVFCINMLVCIINVRENHGHAFHSKDFLKGVFGWCVCVSWICWVWWIKKKKQQISTTIWCCPKCEYIYMQWTNTLSFQRVACFSMFLFAFGKISEFILLSLAVLSLLYIHDQYELDVIHSNLPAFSYAYVSFRLNA